MAQQPVPARAPAAAPTVDLPGLEGRIAVASMGALITALLTTPLDVVKTRMQTVAQPLLRAAGAEMLPAVASPFQYGNHHSEAPPSGSQFFRRGLAAEASRLSGRPAQRGLQTLATESAMETLLRVARMEGVRSLWSGLGPALLMAIPSTALYFTVYDEMRVTLEARNPADSALALYAPLIAGISGRSLTVALVAPLELLRTKAMHRRSFLSRGMLNAMQQEIRAGGLASLWRGLMPTLWRDVPFSGIYWLGYERMKQWLHSTAFPQRADAASPPSFLRTFSAAFLSGVAAGSVAAAVTTPFDVVKTRRQVRVASATAPGGGAPLPAASTLRALQIIWRTEGLRGLFAGLPARTAKVAPSCAIMISVYELGKSVLLSSEAEKLRGAHAGAAPRGVDPLARPFSLE